MHRRMYIQGWQIWILNPCWGTDAWPNETSLNLKYSCENQRTSVYIFSLYINPDLVVKITWLIRLKNVV